MQTLPRAERLRSRKLISLLFNDGRSIVASPIRMLWVRSENEDGSPLQFAVSVPKKNFKRAVDRNRIKRQMREAVRKNKMEVKNFLIEKNKPCAMMFVFTGKEKVEYKIIEDKIILILQRFISEVNS
ncbi:MAG: ribonuclease P protein component [Bacteroidia bacterium]|nr:ribonuclease P protein component [Bacteroidia bacterium]